MKSKRKTGLIFLLLFVCVGVILIAMTAGFLALRASVTELFGTPAPGLSLRQQIMYSIDLYFNQEKLTTPINLAAEEQSFEIQQGESVSMVCLRLEQADLIGDAELMRTYLVYSGLDRLLQSGQFKLSAAKTPLEIASAMLDATPKDAVVTILPGWRIEEVAVNVAGSGLSISKEEFITAAYAPSPEMKALIPAENVPSLEGYLFPGSYVIPRKASLDDLLRMILGAFAKNLDASLVEGFSRQGLSVSEAVTLASVVEKEAVVDDEKPLIASVFLNRIAVGMRLEADPTVQYGLGFDTASQSWWKSPLSGGDLVVNSPYNTYIVPGLPPTPICNPDLGSLLAVAFPADTPYYYFRAACDGSGRHNFSITFEEHVNNACE